MEPKKTKRKLPTWMKDRAKCATSIEENNSSKKSMLNLQLLQFPGSIIYSYNKDDCALICDDIRESLNTGVKTVVGFDMEWPVTYQKGKEPKTALIQLCMAPEKCYLFQISCMPDMPGPLKELLLDERFQKSGVGIESDMWKLGRDFDIKSEVMIKNSIINLTPLANEILGCKENWSLDNMCRHVLMKSLDKDAGIRLGDWAKYPLTDVQMKYAALDAYASLILYEELDRRKNKHESSASNLT